MTNESVLSMPTFTRARWGGLALMVGVLIFIGSRFRHLVDPADRMLGPFMVVAFMAWLVGLLALRAQYRQRANVVGRVGLIVNLVGISLLTAGHIGGFMFELDGPWFVPIVLGTLVLVIGVLLFGIAASGGAVLPRWRAMPLLTGVVGLLWIFFAFDSRPVEGNPEAFIAMRTAFGLCWLVLAYILLTDRSSGTPNDHPHVGRRRREPTGTLTAVDEDGAR